MSDTVRFSALLQAAGKPEVYLPFVDPQEDAEFLRLAKAHRVLTLVQPPAGKVKDHGLVGARFEKHVTYLVFPKSLKAFAEKRVVGIKYDALEDLASHTTPALARTAHRAPKAKAAPKTGKAEAARTPRVVRNFDITVRLRAVRTMHLNLPATTKAEAQAQALEQARRQTRFDEKEMKVTVLKVATREAKTGEVQ
jgi:hypothetical protein